MNYSQLAASGHAFTSSTCIAQGHFQNPDAILDLVASSKPIKDGVLVITGKSIKGRIGVVNNSLVIGGVIDGTGESGVSAIYKLLLLPHGRFVFRQAVPQDYWELKQEVNQGFDELKSFLAGPSSIGLSQPADVAPISTDQRISQQILDSPFMKTSTDNVQSMIDVIGVQNAIDEITHNSQTVSGPNMRFNSGEYTRDCGQLLQEVSGKHHLTKELDLLARKKEKKQELIIPAETPVKQDKNSLRYVALFLAAAVVVVCVASTGGVSKDSALATRTVDAQVATAKSAAALLAVAQGKGASEPTPAKPTAHYILPSQSAINQVAPSGTTSAATTKRDHYFLSSHTIDSGDDKVNQVKDSKEADSKSILFWAQAVRKDPNAPGPREHLAYALLMEGDRDISVQQFEALMVLRRLSPDEIIRYVDALLEHKETNLAKQVIAKAIVADPNQAALNAKLAALDSSSDSAR
ncbi:MAG: DUF4388 domain-containing protein [Candidatus Obscuribacterales bacterium]|nr:DUF4388 domain-containing protein [Candidatus Obscuribacterales bacterium]